MTSDRHDLNHRTLVATKNSHTIPVSRKQKNLGIWLTYDQASLNPRAMDNPNDVVLDRKIQNGSRRITSLHVASVTLWLPCVETHLGGRLFCLDSLIGGLLCGNSFGWQTVLSRLIAWGLFCGNSFGCCFVEYHSPCSRIIFYVNEWICSKSRINFGTRFHKISEEANRKKLQKLPKLWSHQGPWRDRWTAESWCTRAESSPVCWAYRFGPAWPC